ncbi:MAG TPA: hypothetical protein DDW23_00830 [Planctomycetes bacterium]|nr:hypothetical protein [Planctomycetota bacterium]
MLSPLFRTLLATLALFVVAPASHGQEEALVENLRYKSIKEWNIRLAKEMWEEIGDEISIPHQNATGFVVRNTPNTLSIDTDGNGNPDKDIKGLGGLVLLRGKDENGERFDYAVRIRKSGESWDFASSGVRTCKIAGENITIFDTNNNNIWNEIGVDGMMVGKTKGASLLSSVVNLKGVLYTVAIPENGESIQVNRFSGDTGTLSVRSGYESKGTLETAIFKSQYGEIAFDLAQHKDGLIVPVGDYRLEAGFVSKRNEGVSIRKGKMRAFPVTKSGVTAIEWGGPLVMEFDCNPSDNEEEVIVSIPRFKGKAGEAYVNFTPNDISPSILVKDQKGRKIWSGKFCMT